MIRSHLGIPLNPFDTESIHLLSHQQEIFDILKVHAQQGGLCLVLGEPGTGKSVLKQTLLTHDPLIEAVRDQTRTVDLKQVNRVLIQPHWRKDCD